MTKAPIPNGYKISFWIEEHSRNGLVVIVGYVPKHEGYKYPKFYNYPVKIIPAIHNIRELTNTLEALRFTERNRPLSALEAVAGYVRDANRNPERAEQEYRKWIDPKPVMDDRTKFILNRAATVTGYARSDVYAREVEVLSKMPLSYA